MLARRRRPGWGPVARWRTAFVSCVSRAAGTRAILFAIKPIVVHCPTVEWNKKAFNDIHRFDECTARGCRKVSQRFTEFKSSTPRTSLRRPEPSLLLENSDIENSCSETVGQNRLSRSHYNR
jgi:hypothetical protein